MTIDLHDFPFQMAMNMAYFHGGYETEIAVFFLSPPGGEKRHWRDIVAAARSIAQIDPIVLPRLGILKKKNPVAKWTMENQLYIIGRAPLIGVKYSPNN